MVFEEKYLKYKNKYLTLKNKIQHGGSNTKLVVNHPVSLNLNNAFQIGQHVILAPGAVLPRINNGYYCEDAVPELINQVGRITRVEGQGNNEFIYSVNFNVKFARTCNFGGGSRTQNIEELREIMLPHSSLRLYQPVNPIPQVGQPLHNIQQQRGGYF